MATRTCGCPINGPRLREGVGAKLGLCSCCQLLGGVVDLPVCATPERGRSTAAKGVCGGRETSSAPTPFCGACLNPRYREPARKLNPRCGSHPGESYIELARVPATLRRWLNDAPDETVLEHPSAQTQRAMDHRRRHA